MNPVWQRIATFILRRRIPILVLIGLVTAFMYSVSEVKIDQELARVIPMENSDLKGYLQFREIFGEDGNTMIVGLAGDFFDYQTLNGLADLSAALRQVEGVDGVVSLTSLSDLTVNDSLESFQAEPIYTGKLSSQEAADSIKQKLRDLPVYRGLVFDDSMTTTLVVLTLNNRILNSERKMDLVDNITGPVDAFAEAHGLEAHFAGMPVLRVNVHRTVSKELIIFTLVALFVTAITLLLFFRSIYTVIFPLMVTGCVVIFSMGLIGLFGYRVSLITGIIPALITVITIPNSVYLITKYHIEYRRVRNQMKALVLVIEKIGIVTIMTNATTAVGLGVLAFTDINMLREFGIVAGLSVIAAFFISLLLIPIVFSFLPPPTEGQTKHLERRTLGFIIRNIDKTVHNRRWLVFGLSFIFLGLSIWGLSRVKSNAYVADDMPQSNEVIQDLRFIESRFQGALPFEIMINTGRKRGVQSLSNLRRISALQDSMTKYPEISRTLSAADVVKFSRQAFFGGAANAYRLPTRNEFNFIRLYAANSGEGELGGNTLARNLADSTMQITRISATVRDVGSIKMSSLVDSVQQDLDALFPPEDFDTEITGTTQLFIKSNQYLVKNLLRSLALAFIVIAAIMGLLFRSWRMIVISLIPNFLPLMMVAGFMGFFNIPLKPSTALVFGVAFGIAVDDSIHFLARYRLARKLGESIGGAVSNSFQDTGVSMIYTSMILFFGFACFTGSAFGGTQALGLLTSITLGIAMFSNLLLLPVLLLTFDKKTNTGIYSEVVNEDPVVAKL